MIKLLANRERRFNLLVTLALFVISLIFVLPLYWTAVFATRTLSEVFQFPPPIWFGDALLDNYSRIEAVFPPFRPIINSLIVAVPKTLGLGFGERLGGLWFCPLCAGTRPWVPAGGDLCHPVLSALAGAHSVLPANELDRLAQ
ncbi:hypothetical protein N8D56_16355 [Devosia sp. A8/3-2]|nr:hypothetical protein N8D56_16355 [Devosia sp. A8/3-2]